MHMPTHISATYNNFLTVRDCIYPHSFFQSSEYFEVQIRKDERRRGSSNAHRPLYRIVLKGEQASVAYADEENDICNDWDILMQLAQDLPPQTPFDIAVGILRAKITEYVLAHKDSSGQVARRTSASSDANGAAGLVASTLERSASGVTDSGDSDVGPMLHHGPSGAIGDEIRRAAYDTNPTIVAGVPLESQRSSSAEPRGQKSQGSKSFNWTPPERVSPTTAVGYEASQRTTLHRSSTQPQGPLSADSPQHGDASLRRWGKYSSHYTNPTHGGLGTSNYMIFTARARPTLVLLCTIFMMFYTLTTVSGSKNMMILATSFGWGLVFILWARLPKSCILSVSFSEFSGEPSELFLMPARLLINIQRTSDKEAKLDSPGEGTIPSSTSPVPARRDIRFTHGRSPTHHRSESHPSPRSRLPLRSTVPPTTTSVQAMPASTRLPDPNSSYMQYATVATTATVASSPRAAAITGGAIPGPIDPLSAVDSTTTPQINEIAPAPAATAAKLDAPHAAGESLFGVRAVPQAATVSAATEFVLVPRRPTVPYAFYTEAPGSNFMVRGPKYLTDKKKIKSEASLLEFCGMDIFSSPSRPDHIASKLTLPIPPSLVSSLGITIPTRGLKHGDLAPPALTPHQTEVLRKELLQAPDDGLAFPQYLVIQFMYPDYSAGFSVRSPEKCSGFGVVFYFALVGERRRELVHALGVLSASNSSEAAAQQPETENKSLADLPGTATSADSFHSRSSSIQRNPELLQRYANLLQKFAQADLTSTSTSMKGRMKAIPRIKNLDELNLGFVLQSTLRSKNETPFLTGPVHQRWFQGANYLEVDVDLHEYTYAARAVASNIIPYVKDVVLDLGFVIEARAEDELPEVALGAVELSHIDLESVPPLADLLSGSELEG